MSTDPIPDQISRMGDRRLAGCAAKFMALVALGCLALGLTIRRTKDPGTRLAVAVGLCGVVFGFYVSFHARRASRFLTGFFIAFPVACTFVLYICRTLLGWSEELPLRLVLAPLAFAGGFLLGRSRRKLI